MAEEHWASPVLPAQAGSVLQSARQMGTVAQIATAWDLVQTRPVDGAASIEQDEALRDFDQVPLVRDGQVHAVYLRPEGAVPVHSGMFMSATAPMLSFAETADTQRFRLLVHDGQLAGLVTLSDLQRLPVYALIFQLAIAVEVLLVEWLRARCRDEPDAWLSTLPARDQAQINGYYRAAQRKNVAVDKLTCASFGQEIVAAVQLGLMPADSDEHQQLQALIELRNDVCHAKEFAATPDLALRIPQKLRAADHLATCIRQALQALKS